MNISAKTSLADMAFIVGTALDGASITAVLSGGGAATVYAPDAVQSRDLDFVLAFWSSFGVSDICLTELGFQKSKGAYSHPESTFTLEFPQGPLSIGAEVITQWDTLRKEGMTLQILSPTDCVRDRLSWFLFYRNVDYSALEQALAVARRHEIDLDRVRAWAASENALDRYQIFEDRYRSG